MAALLTAVCCAPSDAKVKSTRPAEANGGLNIQLKKIVHFDSRAFSDREHCRKIAGSTTEKVVYPGCFPNGTSLSVFRESFVNTAVIEGEIDLGLRTRTGWERASHIYVGREVFRSCEFRVGLLPKDAVAPEGISYTVHLIPYQCDIH
jgi:hypothetical protein